MPIAPDPRFPESTGRVYERKFGVNAPRRGPMRFQEGVTTDQDVPSGFVTGVEQGHATAPGRMNHNQNVYHKWPEETLAERAHVGSAAWVQAPSMLEDFAHGSFADYGAIEYERVFNPETRQYRDNPAVVQD